MTVAIVDPLEIEAVEFDTAAFRVEWYSGTGAGGQHRNKHQNSCRITHLATGEIATSQCRSRENSLNEAKSAILSRLNKSQSSAAAESTSAIRKQQVGSGQRGDKIRTYRFQDGNVLDHVNNKRASINKVMAGNFELLW